MNISKKGPIRKRLEKKNVYTVRDFLSMNYSNPQELKEISGIKGKKWETTINHAKTSLIDYVCNTYGRVGSSSQQSNTITSFEDDDNMRFDYNCYKPQFCENDVLGNMMTADCNFSIHDLEVCDMVVLEFDRINDVSAMEPNGCGLAKKRWMKLRATLWFLMVT
ncbi:hypothetical protein L1987_07229 [Smallanthus sonchifolius]|uniref:Uncharacterized protein n=1 Tax=Smallanthus sonchifolius TaxID=185202 RepID=A0ACB9K034_9ASTR|nr:hypothetical protein L1987_07229 [Smallanthus sonchifolius]